MTTDNMISTVFEYDAAYASILGSRREQQDAMFLDLGETDAFAVICDGMGGLEDGRQASETAIQTLIGLYRQKRDDESYHQFYVNAVDQLDEAVYMMSKRGGSGKRSGTTIVSAALEKNQLHWFSVGDSRLYLIRGQEIVCATRDHNYYYLLDNLVQNGKMTLEDYEQEKHRGEALISFLGLGGIEIMDISTVPLLLQPGDVILLCSDGLYRCVSEEEMLAVAGEEECAANMVRKLIDLSVRNANGVQDNTTLIVINYKEFTVNEGNEM